MLLVHSTKHINSLFEYIYMAMFICLTLINFKQNKCIFYLTVVWKIRKLIALTIKITLKNEMCLYVSLTV